MAARNAPPGGVITEEMRVSEFTSSDRPTVFETRPLEDLDLPSQEVKKDASVSIPPKDEW